MAMTLFPDRNDPVRSLGLSVHRLAHRADQQVGFTAIRWEQIGMKVEPLRDLVGTTLETGWNFCGIKVGSRCDQVETTRELSGIAPKPRL
jgi:hypothetical protein